METQPTRQPPAEFRTTSEAIRGPWPRWFLIVLMVLGILLVAWAQHLLVQLIPNDPKFTRTQAIVAGLIILGAILFGVTSRLMKTASKPMEFDGEENHSRDLIGRAQLYMTVASVLLALAADALFASKGETPLVIGCWLGGVLLLLVAQFSKGSDMKARLLDRYTIGLGVVLFLALLTHVFRLSTLPYNVDGDFADFGLQARALLIGQQRGIFAYGWAAIPMLGYFPAWASMAAFGNNVAGLNASGVVEGLLTIIGVYLLGRELYRPRVGLLAAALLAASYAFTAASRQSAYMDPVPFMVFAFYFLIIGLRRHLRWAMVASGIMIALCVQMYYSGRLVLPLLLIPFLFLLAFHRSFLLRRWRLVGLWILAGLAALGPMLLVFARGGDAVLSRTREVYVLNPSSIAHEEFTYRVKDVPAVLMEQARRTAFLFNYYIDTGTQFGFTRPLLDPVSAVLFFLGMGLALFHMRHVGNWLLSGWTILTAVAGAFFTINPPFWPRLIILLPPTMLLAALALDSMVEALGVWPRRIPVIGAAFDVVIVGALLLYVGIRNWNTYVQVKGNYAEGRVRIGRFLEAQPASTRAYLVTSGDWSPEDRIFKFLAPGSFVGKLTPDQVPAGIARVGAPTILVLTPEQNALAQELPTRIPGGELITGRGNSPGEIAFYAYRLP